MMMEGLVIFNICLWPWLAYWCLVVASLGSQLLRSLSSSLSLIIMMMIDDDDDDNLFRSSSSPLSWMIMVMMMMMMMTIMIIFSDLPHCLCPSSVVSCHWPLLPKMGWFVIINLVIVKLLVCFFPSDPTDPRFSFKKLVLQVFLSLSHCQCKPNWSFIEVFDWLIKPFNLRIRCVFGNVFIVSTFNF